MRRGEVWDARFDPAEGSEQAGIRPAVIVSRDTLNATAPIVIVVPCTTYRPGRRLYPSQAVLGAGEGGLSVNSVVLCEQIRVLGKHRLLRRRGRLSPEAMSSLDIVLSITLDLAGQAV